MPALASVCMTTEGLSFSAIQQQQQALLASRVAVASKASSPPLPSSTGDRRAKLSGGASSASSDVSCAKYCKPTSPSRATVRRAFWQVVYAKSFFALAEAAAPRPTPTRYLPDVHPMCSGCCFLLLCPAAAAGRLPHAIEAGPRHHRGEGGLE